MGIFHKETKVKMTKPFQTGLKISRSKIDLQLIISQFQIDFSYLIN